jgi:hypothetical protein
MGEEKRKYPYGKVSDQNRRMERKASAETNPEKQDAEYKKADRHFGIHKRVGNLPYHKLGNKENRLQPNEKIPKTKETNRFANRLTRSDGQGIRDSYEYDLYNIILSHLIDGGYAETQETAERIMVNMSEDWRESICEGYKKLPVGRMMRQAIKKGEKLSKYENTPDKKQKVYLKNLKAKELRGQDVTYPTVGEYANKLKGQINTMIDTADNHNQNQAKRKSQKM